jgi:hypothetical protein
MEGRLVLRHGSLFSGIGGFDIAAEWCGWKNVFHCEINEFCNHILNYYWPKAASIKNIVNYEWEKCLPAESPANLIARQASDLEIQTPGISGRQCLEQLRQSGRYGSWAKMFAGLLVGMEG